MYLLKLAMRPWRIAPLSQIFSSLAVGCLLLLVGLLFWMERGLIPVLHRLQGEQVITAYLNPEVETVDEKKIVDSIRMTVGSSAAEVKMVGVLQFIEELKGHYPTLSRDLEDLGTEMNLIIPRYISVSGIFSGSVLERIKEVPGIESAESSKDRYQSILGAFTALRWVARLLMAGLALALLTGLIHLSRMNAYLHQEALALLRFWGASFMELRLPGLFSGFCVGMLGGAVALTCWTMGASWLAEHLRTLSPVLKDIPSPGTWMGIVLMLLGAGIGTIAGGLGRVPSAARSEGRG